MKKIDVIVRDMSTLELNEDASKGDIIDLKEIVKVDSNFISKIIENEKNQVYRSMVENERKNFVNEHKNELLKKEMEISNLKKEYELQIIQNNSKLKENYEKTINDLNFKLQELEKDSSFKMRNKVEEVERNYKSKITELENKINNLIENNKLQQENVILKVKDEYETKISDLEHKYELLKREKTIINTKNVGEDLEKFCNNEVLAYMQNGLFNCKWYKDNNSVKEEDEAKGTKADFIFEVYKNEKQDQLLTSVCLEMKEESVVSTSKKTDAAHFKKLHEDRNKKNCKFAVLVSNLESNNPNISPIYKVREYEDMYVVRPAYMMVILNFIVSLTNAYGHILELKQQEDLQLKEKNDLIAQFDSLKNTYLEKPLLGLENDIKTIKTTVEKLYKNADEIDKTCNKIINSYINSIEAKLSKFSLQVTKI